jgi:hypothetical protein
LEIWTESWENERIRGRKIIKENAIKEREENRDEVMAKKKLFILFPLIHSEPLHASCIRI